MKQNRAVTAWFWLKKDGGVYMMICAKKPPLTPRLHVDWSNFDNSEGTYYYGKYCSKQFKSLYPRVYEKLTNKPKRFAIKIGK